MGEEAREEVAYLSAVGNFLTASVVQFQAMHATLANLWHLHRGVMITDPEEKRLMFQFYYEIDLDLFLDRSPWTFNNHLLVYHRLWEGDDPMVVTLFWSDFWVQIHDLSTGLMFEMMAKQFGDFIRSLLEYDAKSL